MADEKEGVIGGASSYIVRGTDVRPIPDPTALTTQASKDLEAMMRNLIKTEIEHQDSLFAEKLIGAQSQLAERMTGTTRTFSEKLSRIEAQFEMLSERTAEQKKDTKDALDAALAAQKEAVAAQTASSEKSITKSETATIERIKAVETLLSASSRASDDKIDDLKNRIIAIEAAKLGNVETATAHRDAGTDTRAIIAIAITVIFALIALAGVTVAVLKP
jgi:hypothetical protein